MRSAEELSHPDLWSKPGKVWSLWKTESVLKMYGTRTDWPPSDLLSNHSALISSLYACLARCLQTVRTHKPGRKMFER
jgi:hypothetical protein